MSTSINQQQDTYLPPIENPANPIMKLVFVMTKKQFGKVLTPLSVFAARLPTAFGTFYGKISQLDKKLTIPHELVILVRQRVAQINTCSFCVDISRWYSRKSGMSQTKLQALGRYASDPIFTERERAALDYASELTQNKHVAPDTFARMAGHFNEREICEIVWLVASEHVYNITNLGLNIHSDMLCER
jgi:AhpD family alkylhydroperoxidase